VNCPVANVNTFKIRLDEFWANQDFTFDYKSTLTRTGSRSFIDISDINVFLVSLFQVD